MSSESTYADLEIRIGKCEVQGCPVEITLNRALQFRRGYLDPAILPWIPGTSLDEDGERLFRHLLADRRVKDAWSEVRGKYPQRRIRLRIDADAPELHAIPWELLREEREGDLGLSLAAAEATPFSRYLASEHEPGSVIRERPLRIVVAIANPTNLAVYGLQPVDVEAEWALLNDALQGLNVQLSLVGQPCTFQAIDEALEKHEAHVLHFVGHGALTRVTHELPTLEAVIYVADERNEVQGVRASEHAGALARHLIDTKGPRLRLAFLASCQTAVASPVKPPERLDEAAHALRGFGPQLIAAGLPAVVAMQDVVSVSTARSFTRAFYRHLLQHGQVDLAANQARAALLAAKERGAHIPVLFMRLEDGKLLAPDPVRTTLEAIQRDRLFSFFSGSNPAYLRLPLEVVHLTDQQDLHSFDELDIQAAAANDMLATLRDILGPEPKLQMTDPARPSLVILMGGYGSNKSTQLKRIIWETTKDSLAAPDQEVILPVYVDLTQLPPFGRTLANPVEEVILDSLRSYWPTLTTSRLARLLANGPKLRVLFDQGEYLTDQQYASICENIRAFIGRHPRHQYILTAYAETCYWRPFGDLNLHILIIQPLERRKIRHFLRQLPEGDLGGEPLLERIERHGLYDLAAVPWSLVKMVQRARTGRYPLSRTQWMAQHIEEAVATVPAKQGMQAHALALLYGLAWRMQSTMTRSLPLTEAFAIMRDVRGNREYSLEEFYECLVQARLLARHGVESLRFAYGLFQAYCCAQAIVSRADRGRVLDDITAGLGRLSRLRWWEPTLIFVAGLLADHRQELERFLRIIVYGVDLLENEQSFLAARCLMESKQHLDLSRKGDWPKGMARLEEQVTAALVWRLSSSNEPRAVHRGRAASLLGELAPPEAIEHLARTAYGRPRRDRHGEPDFDYSNVRMAAIIGLLRLTELARDELLRRVDPQLVQLLHLWQNQDTHDLIRWLHSPETPGARSVAALALGDLHGQLAIAEGREKEASDVLRALVDTFLTGATDETTLWALAYALSLLDLPAVRQAVFLPFFEKEADFLWDEEQRLIRCKCMAYLIGLLRWQEQQAFDFLVERCLKQARKARLAAVAIQALGSLGDRRYKVLLEMLALGWFGEILPNIETPEESKSYLQRKAIHALAKIGDLETVAVLRQHRGIESLDAKRWDPAVERALYRTSEEIFCRLNWNLSL